MDNLKNDEVDREVKHKWEVVDERGLTKNKKKKNEIIRGKNWIKNRRI